MTPNPYSDSANPPQWGDLRRLAGERAAMLVDDFREHAGRITEVVEEIRYLGPERGWVPTYRAGERVLCVVEIRPASVVASFDLDRPACERVVGLSRVAPIVKRALSEALEDGSGPSVSVELRSKSLTKAWASLLYWLSTGL